MIEIVSFCFVVALVFFVIGYMLGESVGKGKAYREELVRKSAAEEQGKWAQFIENMRGSK